MKFIFPLLILLCLLTGCENEKDIITPETFPEHELNNLAFLNKTKPGLVANLGNESFNWQFAAGDQNFQMTRSFTYQGTCEPCNPNRIVQFSLTQNAGTNQVQLQLPVVNVLSKTDYDLVLGVGKKSLAGYQLSIRNGHRYFHLNTQDKNGEIEILKIREANANTDKVVCIWFRIKGTMQSAEGNTPAIPLDALFLAEVTGLGIDAYKCNTPM